MTRILFYLCTCLFLMHCTAKKKDFAAHTFIVDNGYGYTITFNKKTLIKQNVIPVIAQKRVFCNKEEALKVAHYVIGKLRTNNIPTLTIDDLNALNINFNCGKKDK